MNHVYFQTEGELKILTPGNFTMDDVQLEEIEFSPDYTARKCTYPNGFEILFEHQANMFVIHTNRPLTQNEDGSFTAPTMS